MGKIKQWLRRWLGVEEELKELRERVLYDDDYYESWCKRLEKRLCKTEDVIGKTIRAGFDNHINRPSWIEVAWRDDKGREHVHFYEADWKFISHINDMLKSFRRDNVIIDTQPDIAKHFKW